jgi:hypothetical protein
MSVQLSRYFYKSGDPNKIGLSPNQTFIMGLWELLDSLIKIVTLGRVGGRFSDNYIWNTFRANADKKRVHLINAATSPEDEIICCECDTTCSNKDFAVNHNWGWAHEKNQVTKWFCPECSEDW